MPGPFGCHRQWLFRYSGQPMANPRIPVNIPLRSIEPMMEEVVFRVTTVIESGWWFRGSEVAAPRRHHGDPAPTVRPHCWPESARFHACSHPKARRTPTSARPCSAADAGIRCSAQSNPQGSHCARHLLALSTTITTGAGLPAVPGLAARWRLTGRRSEAWRSGRTRPRGGSRPSRRERSRRARPAGSVR